VAGGSWVSDAENPASSVVRQLEELRPTGLVGALDKPASVRKSKGTKGTAVSLGKNGRGGEIRTLFGHFVSLRENRVPPRVYRGLLRIFRFLDLSSSRTKTNQLC
jgi:hypothetical protein